MWLSLLALLLWQAAPMGSPTAGGFAVLANFNGRSGGATIPANMIGTNVSSIYGSAPFDGTTGSNLNALGAAGLHHQRLFIDLNVRCPTSSTCNWSVPNAQLADLKTADSTVKVLAVFVNTPSDLESVASSACSPPNNNSSYATVINAFLSQATSGEVDSVEVGNESDNGLDWCPSGGSSVYLSTYKSMIAVVAPAIKTANPSILVGASPLGSPASHISTWFGSGGLVGSATFDFLSYHLYLAATYTTWASVLSGMQSTSAGVGYYFALAQSTLAGQGFSGQLWVTEGADSYSSASADCCRFDSTYSAMWNVLNQVDYLNAVSVYGATALPNRFYLFTNENNIANGWCLTGGPALDCKNGTTPNSPMPNYYAYSLLNTLGLPSGGNVAQSVSPSSTLAGVSAAAFYIGSTVEVLIVNPTTTGYNGVTVAMFNPGSVSGTCTAYLLNSSNTTITTSSPTCTAISSGYQTVVALPALSTVAVKLQ